MNECCPKLDDFLDGDLSPLEEAEFLASAKACPDCQSAIQSHGEIYQLLQTGWNEVASPSFASTSFDSLQLDSGHELNQQDDSLVSRPPKTDVQFRTENSLVSAGGITLLICLVVSAVWIAAGFRDQQGTDLDNTGGSSELLAKDNSQNEKKHSEDDQKTQRLAQLSNKAVVELSESHLGIRLDEPDDDFTFIQVYRAADLSKIENSKPNQPSL